MQSTHYKKLKKPSASYARQTSITVVLFRNFHNRFKHATLLPEDCSPKLNHSAEDIIQMAFNAQFALRFKYFVWCPFLLFCDFVLALENHKCWIPLNTKISVASNEYTISALKSTPENLRITVQYTERMRKLNKFALLKRELLEPAVAFWSKTLRARNPPSGPLLLNRACVNDAISVYSDGQKYCAKGCSDQTLCHTEPIPDDYLGQCMEIKNGMKIRRGTAKRGLPNTDFLLIVDADADARCNDGFLGFGAVCQVDNSLNRQVTKERCLIFMLPLVYHQSCFNPFHLPTDDHRVVLCAYIQMKSHYHVVRS
ncbi:hypothetical protein P879_06801 [Paragonimus westermani]|uniref:Uncharacterized protein n=1 Tax=Paragonimus westermani TaxID=34504 RepID=A0A8T0DQX7_9TREM|nr:hypothetical protein P879_06801 [Paragonimus westermani]